MNKQKLSVSKLVKYAKEHISKEIDTSTVCRIVYFNKARGREGHLKHLEKSGQKDSPKANSLREEAKALREAAFVYRNNEIFWKKELKKINNMINNIENIENSLFNVVGSLKEVSNAIRSVFNVLNKTN